jgi:NAD(P)-dependent dehydrogenase (short-subunit alcohol dehydrogenase family)
MDTEQTPLESGFGPQTTAAEVASGIDLRGKVVIVTGGHAGLGLETTRVLASAGAAVTVGARDVPKAKSAVSTLGDVEVAKLDLSDPGSIDQFGEEFIESKRSLDLLINNAGIMATPLMRDRRGYEMQFATNHLGHFQLTARLWPALKRARSARVISLSSFGHRFSPVHLEDPNFTLRPYEKWAAYGQSKTANSLFAVALDRRGKSQGIRAFAVHPGRIVATDLARYMTEEDRQKMGIRRERGVFTMDPAIGGGGKSVEQGAATTVWAATSDMLAGKGGVYCADCDISEIVPDDSQLQSGVRRYAIDKATAEALWAVSERLTDLSWPDDE